MSTCSHCAGPVAGAGHAGRPWPGRPAAAYCCYGCLSLGEADRQIATSPHTPGWKLDGLGVRLGVGVLVAGQSMIFGLALNLHDDVPAAARDLAQWLILGATLAVVALLGGPLARAAAHELRRGRLTIEALFLLTLGGALAASLQAHLTGRGHIYYEVVSVLLVVYTLGKVIGARARAAAVAGSRAWAGQLSTCRIVDEKGRTRTVPVAEVLPGDVVEVHAGETVAVDGVVRRGTGFVGEAAVTGEPFAVVRRPGDRVLAGAAAHDATFHVEATAPGTERQVDRLLAAVEAAHDRPLSLQRQADRVGRVFFPLVVAAAAGTFAYWALLTPAGWEAALFHAMSVLLVACPCAIGLATPVVVWAAVGRLAERGLIVRAGDAVERLAAVDRVLFDKTGTLTDERFALVDVVTGATGDDRARLLGWVAAVEAHANHPVAKPFAALPVPPGEEPRVLGVRTAPGCGVEAEIEAADGTRHTVHVGRPEWIAKNLTSQPPSLPGNGEPEKSLSCSPPFLGEGPGEGLPSRPPNPPTPFPKKEGGAEPRSASDSPPFLGEGLLADTGHRVDVAVDGELAAVAVVAERLRESVPEMLAEFRRLGLPVEVLTGDTSARAAALGLPPTRAGLLPDDKREIVARITAAGGRPLVVGDGINDAAALAVAHSGVALASGTDLAVGAAAMTLYHGDLRALPWAVELSRAAVRAVRANLRRALAFNLVGMTLAACGVLHPVVAVLLMTASSLLLVLSSTRVGVVARCGESAGRTRGVRDGVAREEHPVAHAPGSPVRLRAAVHFAAFAAQGIVLVLLVEAFRPSPLPLLLGFVGGGLALAVAWLRWPRVPHTLDMCYGMVTLGNLGMLLGWWADAGFAPLHDGGCPLCAAAARADFAAPGMWVGMLLGANAAMRWLGRRPLPRGGNHVAAMFTGGNVGMVVGMLAGGWAAGRVECASVAGAVVSSFVGMTAGMLAGMLAGTWAVEELLAAARPLVLRRLTRPAGTRGRSSTPTARTRSR